MTRRLERQQLDLELVLELEELLQALRSRR